MSTRKALDLGDNLSRLTSVVKMNHHQANRQLKGEANERINAGDYRYGTKTATR
jgi:hypothetical protein